MKINLRQARRLERDIAVVQNKLAGSVNVSNVRVSIHEEFAPALKAIQDKLHDALTEAVALNLIRFSIRKSIETLNETAGINTLMNEEAMLKDQIKAYSLISENEMSEADYKVAHARHATMRNGGTPATQYGQVIDYIQLDGVVDAENARGLADFAKSAQKRVNKIVEQLGYLNTSTMIELDDVTVAKLDTHGIIM